MFSLTDAQKALYILARNHLLHIESPKPFVLPLHFVRLIKNKTVSPKRLQRERPRNPEEASAEMAEKNQLVEESENP